MKHPLSIAIISTYPPTHCGIATYSRGLIQVFGQQYPGARVRVVAAGQPLSSYPSEVIRHIGLTASQYRKTAEMINRMDVDVVHIQHEYGIYHGPFGQHLVDFCRTLRKPIVLTLHTVLNNHLPERQAITRELVDHAQAVTVMTNSAKRILVEGLGVAAEKIVVIPHFAPSLELRSRIQAKAKLGLSGKTVLTTFGLLSRNKGIEYALRAIGKLKNRDQFVYLVLGQTHPSVLEGEGEQYREELLKLRTQLTLEKTVRFIDKFFPYQTLIDYLAATDIYLAPQNDPHQISSGTVSYALASGAVVIGTPTLYNKEVLSRNRGVMVPFGNAHAIAQAINRLITNPQTMAVMQSRAWRYSRRMVLTDVVRKHYELFERVRGGGLPMAGDFLKHLHALTTPLGIIQHAAGEKPDLRFGYSIDDQARGLIAAIGAGRTDLAPTYLRYIKRAQLPEGAFHNFSDAAGNFIDRVGSQDSWGRAIWALGVAVKAGGTLAGSAQDTLRRALRVTARLEFLRPRAFALLGLLEAGQLEEAKPLAEQLLYSFSQARSRQWQWFENTLTYDNGIIPFALARAGTVLANKRLVTAARQSFAWLDQVSRIEAVPAPIGQNGWYPQDGTRAVFDEQPLEAAAMVLAASELRAATGDKGFEDQALLWLQWFFGNNILGLPMIDRASKGVYDGLKPNGVNGNQGAESIVTFVMALNALGIMV